MRQADSEPLHRITEEILSLCAEMHCLEARLLERLAQLERLRPWNARTPSAAHYLEERCGYDRASAREKPRLAALLADREPLREAFHRGRLSYGKLRTLARLDDPAEATRLLEQAQAISPAQLERLVRRTRQAEHLSDPTAVATAHRRRYLRWRPLHDGSLRLEARLPGERGALFTRAIDGAARWLDRGEEANEQADDEADDEADEKTHNETHDERERRATAPGAAAWEPGRTARYADALSVIAEHFLAAPPASEAGLATADRCELVIHAPLSALPEHGGIDRDDPPQTDDGTVLPGETVRRIGCDGALVRLLERAPGEVIDVGRKTRVISPALRRALLRRDGTCTYPGCASTRLLEAHHLRHWADGGATTLENLTLTCRRHHALLHEGGCYAVRDNGAVLFCNGDGSVIMPVDPALERRVMRARRDRGAPSGAPPPAVPTMHPVELRPP